MFRYISSGNFPPFGEFKMRLPPVESRPNELAEVHLLTGVNGTGKTRLLSAITAMLGNQAPLAKRLGMDDPVFKLRMSDDPDVPGSSAELTASHSIIGWTGGSGHIHQWSSTVPAFAYSGTAYIVDSPVTVLAEMGKPNRQSCLSTGRPETDSKMLLQAIMNLKIQAAMDSMPSEAKPPTTPTTHPAKIINALERTIAKITGLPFAFAVKSYPKPALEVTLGNKRIPFNLLPDGLRSIIGWIGHAVVMMDVWFQGKNDPMAAEAIFLLDEIECHLHPAWQRRILPAFQVLFPQAQIFVATHSPFVIASLNHGWIHRFILNDGKVTIAPPRAASEGDSYVSVVEDIMGVQEWYDPETEGLLVEFRKHRDAAYHGDLDAKSKAQDLASKIAHRSMELEYMMGRELSQMDRQLAKKTAKA